MTDPMKLTPTDEVAMGECEAAIRGLTIRLGKDFYTQWTFRLWWRSLTIENGGYAMVVPWWKCWSAIPFVWKRLRGEQPWEMGPIQ